MSYNFFIVFTLLSISSISNAKRLNVEVSAETTKFFHEKVLTTCKKEHGSPKLYYELFSDSIKSKGLVYSGYFYQNIFIYLKTSDCSEATFLELRKRIDRDLRLAHLFELEKIKKELFNFRLRNLSGSAQFAKYINYRESHSLVDIPLDPEIAKLQVSIKLTQDTRKTTCTDVMNLKAPLSIEKPKSLDTIGWCYAYTASDLVAHALGRNPSAIHSALLFNDKFLAKLLGIKKGGFIGIAINEMIDEGICLEEDMPSGDYHFSKNGYNLNKVYNAILELGKKYKEHNTKAEEIMKDLCSKNPDLVEDLKQIFPGLNPALLGTILAQESNSEAFKKIADKSCKISRDEDLRSLKVHTVLQNQKIFKTLDEQLTKGNILGIHFKSEILEDYTKNRAFANHAASIVGRRFNPMTNSCEYLVRNSDGDNCGRYPKDYTCINGHIWIGEEFFKFNNAINEVIYVEKK